jgi:hypothetical protein
MLFCLALGAITIALHTPSVYAATTLGFDTQPFIKQAPVPDSFFDVYLNVSDVSGLFGFDVKITWDNSLITYKSEVHTEYLNAIWGPLGDGFDWSLVTAAGSAGSFRYVALSLGDEFSTTGTQILLKLSFDIVNPTTNSMKETPLTFEIHKLSDKQYQEIANTANDGTVQIWGKTPTLTLIPTKTTCHILGETFDVAVSVSNALSVTSLTFDIRYDPTLLDFVSITWNSEWGPGAEDHSVDGTVTGSTSGAAKDNTQTLLTIRLEAAYDYIWRDRNTIPGSNDLTGIIYIETATLGYPSPPSLGYSRSGTGNKITVGSDVTYHWVPIQGDVLLDGEVDLFDLVHVANLYDQDSAEHNLTGYPSNLIDIFDLVVIANNFGYKYTP